MLANSHAGEPAGNHEFSAAVAEAALLFAGLRSVLNLSLQGVAELLATSPGVVSALETGRLEALPPWPETQRLVETYTGLAGCDAGPVLSVLKLEFDRLASDQVGRVPQESRISGGPFPLAREYSSSNIPDPHDTDATAVLPAYEAAALALRSEPGPPAPPVPRWRKGRGGRPVPVGTQLDDTDSEAQASAQSNLRLIALTGTVLRLMAAAAGSRGVRLGVVGCGLALVLLLALAQPRFIHFVSSRLPDPMARGLRSVHDYLLIRFAPEREGLRWIEVSDPRTRRSDKLHNGGQSD